MNQEMRPTWEQPKTNWDKNQVVKNIDFNRIEKNIEYNHWYIDQSNKELLDRIHKLEQAISHLGGTL